MSSIIQPKDFSLLTKEAINCHFLMALLFLSLNPRIINASDDSIHVGKHVIAAGGGISTSTEYVSKGTVGQTVIGRSLTNSYQVFSGFWRGAPQGCCINITGDLNSDGSENTILDLNFLVNQIFRGGPDPDRKSVV